MQAALRDVYGRTELIRRLDPATTAADEARIPLGASFLRSLIVQEFIDHQFAMSLEPSTPAEQLSPVMVEAQDSGMDLEVTPFFYVEWKRLTWSSPTSSLESPWTGPLTTGYLY